MLDQAEIAHTNVVNVVNVVIERMSLHHVPEVMAIERQSFPMPWPEPAYRHELTENPKAYFIVARSPQLDPAPAVSAPKRNWLKHLFHPVRKSSITTNHSTNNPVVGYAGMWNMVDEMHIATIASHPQLRGRGIGELLLIHLLRECQRQDALNATLEVRVSNTIAQSLYKKYGFEEVGYRKAYYHDNREDAFILTVTTFQTAAYAARLDALEAMFMEAHHETIS